MSHSTKKRIVKQKVINLINIHEFRILSNKKIQVITYAKEHEYIKAAEHFDINCNMVGH